MITLAVVGFSAALLMIAIAIGFLANNDSHGWTGLGIGIGGLLVMTALVVAARRVGKI